MRAATGQHPETVHSIQRLSAGGLSVNSIAAKLNGVGERTGSGRRWTAQTVAASLALSVPQAENDAPGERWRMTTAAASFSGGIAQTQPDESDHFVFFYDDDAELLRELARYVASGLREDGHAVVIATRAHREALLAALPPSCLQRAERDGRFLALDAQETLMLFMRDGSPDADLFDASVGLLVRDRLRMGGHLSAYGEMVAVLWKEGNVVGALQLEELWNNLQRSTSFALFCAYPLADAHGQPGDGLAQICHRHTLVHTSRHLDLDAYTAGEIPPVLLDNTRGPLLVESSQREAGMVTRARGPLHATCPPAGYRPIFVVDDDSSAQLLIGEALSCAGLVNPVVTSLDGSEAMAALRELALLGPAHVPALIFLDWQMPGCDGIEVLRWMRSTPGLELVPVVMLSANDSAQQVMQAYDLGASSYLVKPLAFSALGATVRGMGLPWRLA